MPQWLRGCTAVAQFFADHVLSTPGEFRMVATMANGQPAFVAYQRAQDDTYQPHAVTRAHPRHVGYRAHRSVPRAHHLQAVHVLIHSSASSLSANSSPSIMSPALDTTRRRRGVGGIDDIGYVVGFGQVHLYRAVADAVPGGEVASDIVQGSTRLTGHGVCERSVRGFLAMPHRRLQRVRRVCPWVKRVYRRVRPS
jgi:hypothetical protein